MSANLPVVLQPDQWRSGPQLLDGEIRPDPGQVLEVRLIRDSLQHVVDEVDRPTGWVTAKGYWDRPSEPAGDLVRLLIRVEALPEDAVPDPAGGDDR